MLTNTYQSCYKMAQQQGEVIMKVSSDKENSVSAIFFVIGLLCLSTGIYDFVYHGLHFIELINIFAIFLILISLGLVPRLFFIPFNQLFSPTFKLPTRVNVKIQRTLFFVGVFLIFTCLIWTRLN